MAVFNIFSESSTDFILRHMASQRATRDSVLMVLYRDCFPKRYWFTIFSSMPKESSSVWNDLTHLRKQNQANDAITNRKEIYRMLHVS